MLSNLGGGFTGAAYWQVEKAFTAYRKIGYCDSNTYFGNSKAFGNVYETITLQPGTELHDLGGRTFAVVDGHTFSVTIELNHKHPFERVYLPSRHIWPLDHLRRLDVGNKPPGGYRKNDDARIGPDELEARDARRIGRSIDLLIKEGA